MTIDPHPSAAGTPTGQEAQRSAAFAAQWARFTKRLRTDDSLRRERRGFRRWMLAPYIAFVIPIDDADVRARLAAWQNAFADTLPYQPQPVERLHITLHYVGQLRTSPWLLLPNTWMRASLGAMAERVKASLAECASFTIGIGPLNAFGNTLFAEVHDSDGQRLRAMRLRVRRSMHLRARPASQWSYLPHITLGYWGEQPAAPLIARLQPLREVEPLPLRVTRVLFTIYWRDQLPPAPDVLVRAREELIAEYPLAPRA